MKISQDAASCFRNVIECQEGDGGPVATLSDALSVATGEGFVPDTGPTETPEVIEEIQALIEKYGEDKKLKKLI